MRYEVLNLVRIWKDPEMTLGVLTGLSLRPLATLELPWKDNSHNASCIPEGQYRCVLDSHPLLGDVLRLNDVPGRDGILIHVGNYLKDTTGCILLGKMHSKMQDGSIMVSDSKEAMQEFIYHVKLRLKTGIILEIGEAQWPSTPERLG